jgi:hypothetical protein
MTFMRGRTKACLQSVFRLWAGASRSIKFANLALLLSGIFPLQSVSGYSLEGPSWPAGSVTFQLGLGPAGRTLIDGNTSWNIAASPGFGVWDLSIQRFQLVNVTAANGSVSSGDGLNSIVFATTVFGQAFGSSTLAVTYYRYSGSVISEADILFNSNLSFDSYRGPLRFGTDGRAIGEVRRVLIHELGHALGLAHPDQHGQTVDAIMNSLISNRETTSADDITGAQSMYGVRPPPRVASTTKLANGHMLLQCVGVPSAVNRIEASADLTAGFSTTASLMADASGAFQYEDVDTGSFSKRFYRIAYP